MKVEILNIVFVSIHHSKREPGSSLSLSPPSISLVSSSVWSEICPYVIFVPFLGQLDEIFPCLQNR